MRFVKFLVLGFSLLVAIPLVKAATLYVEAERFDNVGGWTIDAQFRQQMGSTYLIAAGTGWPCNGCPVSVAVQRRLTEHEKSPYACAARWRS